MSERRPLVRAALDFLWLFIGLSRVDVYSTVAYATDTSSRPLSDTADGGFHEKFALSFRDVWPCCRRPVVFARRYRLRAGGAETPDQPRPCAEHRSDQYRRRAAAVVSIRGTSQ